MKVSEEMLDEAASLLIPFLTWASDQPELPPRQCRVFNCERLLHAGGLCGLHYNRKRNSARVL